jgi:DNA-binding XRE family transcriptional regulator
MVQPSTPTTHKRGLRPNSPPLPDLPYTMNLPDGRIVFVTIPGEYTIRDRSGEIGFRPEGVRLLDRVRAMAMKVQGQPTPGHIAVLREALGLTQEQMGRKLGVNKLTISRYECGRLRPSARVLRAMEKLREKAASRGVVLSG